MEVFIPLDGRGEKEIPEVKLPKRDANPRVREMGTEKKPKGLTAFVFTGGANLGAVQVGMLKALADAGIRADFAIGASVGAINAVAYAGNPTIEGVLDLVEEWLQVKREMIFPFPVPKVLWRIFRKKGGLVSSRALRKLLTEYPLVEKLEDTKIPVYVVTCDLLSGEEVVISQGETIQALMASAAIPGIFEPVEIAGRLLVDGGVVNNVPIARAIELGASRIYVMFGGHACALDPAPYGATETAFHALTLMMERKLVSEVERHAGEAEIYRVPPLCPLRVRAGDFSKTAELIRLADEVTKSWLLTATPATKVVPIHLHEVRQNSWKTWRPRKLLKSLITRKVAKKTPVPLAKAHKESS